MQTINSCFQVLGLESTAGKNEIKRAYALLVRKYHPDTALVPNRFLLERVISAYHILSSADLSMKMKPSLKDAVHIRTREAPLVTRLRNIQTLAQSGRKGAYYFLRQDLYDKNEQIVCASIRAVASLGILQSVPEFSAIFRAGSEKIKLHILDAVDTMQQYTAFKGLINQAVSDDFASVRGKAWKLFARAGARRTFV
ncbi:MAG: J domain-containing protein [Spirochaetales bacterium]|nr:J domain-containing protein [Spirochaetales bacterium]